MPTEMETQTVERLLLDNSAASQRVPIIKFHITFETEIQTKQPIQFVLRRDTVLFNCLFLRNYSRVGRKTDSRVNQFLCVIFRILTMFLLNCATKAKKYSKK